MNREREQFDRRRWAAIAIVIWMVLKKGALFIYHCTLLKRHFSERKSDELYLDIAVVHKLVSGGNC